MSVSPPFSFASHPPLFSLSLSLSLSLQPLLPLLLLLLPLVYLF